MPEFAYNKFVYIIKSVTNYILDFSLCLHVHCSYDPVLLYKSQCPGPCASSPLKHEAYAKSCCGLALEESLWGSDFISHNPELLGCSSALLGLCVAKNGMSVFCRECRLCPESTRILDVWGYS